jgi:predicted phosphodiesterase
MPIEVLRDLKAYPKYKLNWDFGIRQLRDPNTLSLLDGVRDDIALENWKDFYNSWYIGGPYPPDVIDKTKRNILKSLAQKFNLVGSDHEDAFDSLWEIFSAGQSYEHDVQSDIDANIVKAYEYAARTANGEVIDELSFSRVRNDLTDENIVIFSDQHMTHHKSLPNYFDDWNYELYLDVLDYYAESKEEYCLVENGDQEDCIIYEPTAATANASAVKAQGVDFPITLTDSAWDGFMKLRYDQRKANLESVISHNSDYYNRLRDKFIPNGKYVRLAGNHDTYLDDEAELQSRIQDVLLGTKIYDVVCVDRNGNRNFMIMHGHQFDSVSTLHGKVPYARSLGEVYSECMGWAMQGADRVWTSDDTKRWYNGHYFYNYLAREDPGIFKNGGQSLLWALIDESNFDLFFNDTNRIKSDSKDWVESLLGHEVAWEYFENGDGFNAFTLEVWRGDEQYKLRHLNEVAICRNYQTQFSLLNSNKPLPKLILGHTHEPRQNSIDRDTGTAYGYYLNSGSAGRFENLLWCVEIRGTQDFVCSWSRIDGKLRRTTWKAVDNLLMHDYYTYA